MNELLIQNSPKAKTVHKKKTFYKRSEKAVTVNRIIDNYKVFRNIINPSIKQVKAHKLREFYPWPSPSPYYSQLPYSVIHVPMEEVDHFLETIISRYIKSLKKNSVEYFTRYNEKIACEHISDFDFNQLFTSTYYSRFIKSLNTEDEVIFFDFIDSNIKYYKIDNSYFSNIERLDGHYLESTITLLKEIGPQQLEVVAIYYQNKIYTASDSNWGLTKMLVVQASSNRVLISDHPRCHFPVDSMIGVSHCLLDHKSIIYQLLYPHFYMQLPLNFAVLYISKSVALNNQDEIYTTLATTKQGFLDSFLTGFRGSKNTHSYTPYNFRLAPQKIFGPYGDFLEDYWWCIYKFVKSIIERLEIDFLDFKDWSNNLAFMIPGFPSFEEIQNAETFTRVITSFIHNVSVEHSADHYSYASYSPLKVPLRLRKNYQHNEKHFYVKGEDYVRHKLADEMFFKTYTLKKLIDVTYNFPIELNQEVKIFKENLKLVDNKWKNQFIPLNDIATSIQY